MTKRDPKKELDSYRATAGKFRLLEVPPLQYLMIDGHGDPNTAKEFTDALQALYPVAYKLKFASKRELGLDYVVGPLEGLWWSAEPAAFTTARDKTRWDWTMMTLVPSEITNELFEAAHAAAGAKKPPASLGKVRIETLEEGLCVQTLHRGPFDDEGPVLEQMHAQFIPENGLRMTGKHHEIYFSDFRRVAPEKLRTILRQPVAR